jgi:hypothetical protein
MRHQFFLTLIFILSAGPSFGQDYPASLIPDSLKANAHVVIRDYIEEFEFQNVNTGTERNRSVFTVLDKNGDGDALLTVVYDKDSKVDIVKVNLYNKDGKRIKSVKQSDIIDVPAYDGASLYSDNRLKLYKPSYAEYPYTVEYEYEVRYTNLISYGSWSPITDYDISSEHSELVIIYPNDIHYKKKELNSAIKSKITKGKNGVTETWEFKNVKAIESEPYSVSFIERVPRIFLMPEELKYGKYSGKAGNWSEYGKWINSLYQGRDELSEPEKIKLRELLKNTEDTIKKIEIIYKYFQGRTRYVGIQLGIGGFQPFSAQTVFETGFGDCKALTNYMHALLKETGIKSFPALVSSGKYIESIFLDFPNFQQFDHVILCVPVKNDTLWLECTSQNIPFAFLGDFTDDRDVLLITEEGGKFAHTKSYSADDNFKSSSAQFKIDASGSASCSIKTRYQGLQYNSVIKMVNSNSDDQKKWIYSTYSLPSLRVDKYVIKNENKPIPFATVEFSLVSSNYCSLTGNYVILPLNRVNFQTPVRKNSRERQSDIVILRSSTDIDSIVYQIPAECKIETVPEGRIISSAFGEFSFSTKVDGDKILYTRKLKLNQGHYKASEYRNLYDFFLSVSKADNEKVLLVKNLMANE